MPYIFIFLEMSSMKRRKFMASPSDLTLNGPLMSVCTGSGIFEVDNVMSFGSLGRLCLPFKHISQGRLLVVVFRNPSLLHILLKMKETSESALVSCAKT